MDTVNALNQMAEYDFNTPIDVKIIFEDSDDDPLTFQNSLCEKENTNDNNNNKQDKISSENLHSNGGVKNNTVLENNSISEISSDNSNNSINAEIRSNTNYGSYYPNQNHLDANQYPVVIIDDDAIVINDEQRLPSSGQINKNRDEPTCIEDFLNRLSENLVFVMQSFYHYGKKKTNVDDKKREKVFHFIKSYFFELSYTTVEAIFLQQEQNVFLIDKFIDNTVLLANKKSLHWKCHKNHVLPFFKELLTWTKKKRELIKQNRISCHANENILLKQQLDSPLQPLNCQLSEIVGNTNIAFQKTQQLCIFSSGTPGNQISINIDADTLLQVNEQQQNGALEQVGKHNVTPCSKARRKTPVARRTDKNNFNNTINKNSNYDRPPPPYNMNSKSITYRLEEARRKTPVARTTNQNRTPYNMNSNNLTDMTYYNNMRQPHQIHQNMGQPTASYPAQEYYINTSQGSPTLYHNTNNTSQRSPMLYHNTNNTSQRSPMLYHNTNNNIPMYGTQVENEVTSSATTMNVPSLTPNTCRLKLRCCMCGKTTSIPAPISNTCHVPVYCSHLCQELDRQMHKPAPWSNT